LIQQQSRGPVCVIRAVKCPTAGRLFATFERERFQTQKIRLHASIIFQIAQSVVFAFLQITFGYYLEAGAHHRSTQRVFIVDEGMPPISNEIVYDECFVIIWRTGSEGIDSPFYVCALQVGFVGSSKFYEKS
jgi:hypothetical protein